jgi:hypothetical protein
VAGFFAGVLLREELLGDLPELADVELGHPDSVDIIQFEDILFVGVRREQIIILLSLLMRGLIPKYQINPSRELLCNLLTLQGLPHPKNKLLRRLRPIRQLSIIHLLLILLLAKFNLIPIPQKLRPVIKLGYALPHITGVHTGRLILLFDAVEEAVGVVDLLPLVLPVKGGERLEADEEVVDEGGVGVEGTVEEVVGRVGPALA